MSFLTRLDIQHQHGCWMPATYFKHNSIAHDLVCNFAHIEEVNINLVATECWASENIQTEKIHHRPWHLTPAYHPLAL
jgi:hypothetical protein